MSAFGDEADMKLARPQTRWSAGTSRRWSGSDRRGPSQCRQSCTQSRQTRGAVCKSRSATPSWRPGISSSILRGSPWSSSERVRE